MAPPWAAALVEELCAAARVPPPILRWRHARRRASSGVTRLEAGTVAVTAGTDSLDQQLTLLHEVAHWLARARDAAGEPRITLRLLRHRLSAVPRPRHSRRGVLAREGGRYPASLRHARALGLDGAKRPGSADAWHCASGHGCGGHRACSSPSTAFAWCVTDAGRAARCVAWGGGSEPGSAARRSGRHILLATG